MTGMIQLKKTAGLTGLALALGLGVSSSAHAASILLDFENAPDGTPLVAGQIIDNQFASQGVTIQGVHPSDPSLNLAVIQDSATTFELDQRTPGFGPGNDTAQGNILIVPRDNVDADNDGLIDAPQSQSSNPGGRIFFFFDSIFTDASVTVIDDDLNEREGFIRAFLDDSEVAFVQFEALGDNSVQTVSFADTEFNRLNVDLGGSGGLISVDAGQVEVVPTPSALLAGMLGLGFVAARRRRATETD